MMRVKQQLQQHRWHQMKYLGYGPALSVIQSDAVSLGSRVKSKALPLWDTITVPSGSLVNSPEAPDWGCCKTTNETVKRGILRWVCSEIIESLGSMLITQIADQPIVLQ